MIAITGGSGFIGSHIVDKLLLQGSQVRILDPRLPHRRDVEYSATDVTDLDALCQGLKGTSAVFHLAAVSNVNVAFREPIATVKLNDLGTVNVLEAARRNDLERVFFASTVWVYAGCREEQVDEETPFQMPGAGHVYTSSKIAAEFYLHDYHELYGLRFTILRYGIPYGPRAREGTVVPIFVKKVLSGEPITIYGDGNQFRNFLYVEDLAEGNVLAMAREGVNQTFNLEGMRPISVKEVAETINAIVGGAQIVFEPARPGDYRGKVVSAEKAKRVLGWQPQVDFFEGMTRYVAWYRATLR